MDKKTVNVYIAGERIVVKTGDADGYIEGIARELDDKINDLCIRGGVSKIKAAIFVALDLLDENKKMKVLIKEIEKKQ